jgi:phosphate transport system substrate-binding protein
VLRVRAITFLAPVALLAAACGSSDAVGLFVTGSSTVEPISVRVAELFEDVSSDVFVSVEGPGTGDGFKKFCAGEADMANASRHIKDPEIEDCAAAGVEWVELSVAYDGLAIVTHPDTPIDCVSFADLYALLGPEAKGTTSWSEAGELAAELGSTTELPDLPLEISAPGTESGTYDSFVELVIADIAEARVEEGVVAEADAEALRPDYPSAADDNMIVATVGGRPGTLGFIGFAYAEASSDQVKLLAVDGGDGCVEPTAETIADGTYPISRTLFVYVSLTAAAERPSLVDFVDFYVGEGLEPAVTAAGYVLLPPEAEEATRAAWAAVRP